MNAVAASRCVLTSVYQKGFYHFPMTLSAGRFDQVSVGSDFLHERVVVFRLARTERGFARRHNRN